jgi:hypothetical protein
LNLSSGNRTLAFTRFLHLLYIVFFIFYIYFLIAGSNFYLTPLKAQPHHQSYRSLRPAGLWGHGFGVIGSALMIFMLLYTLRKRTRLLGNLGALSYWLQFHIFCGIAGPLLVILHSSFKVQGLIAVSFWSMIAVAASGFLGRYIYIQIPRTISGKELNLSELHTYNEDIKDELQKNYDLPEQDIRKLEQWYAGTPAKQKNLLLMLFSMLYSDLIRPLSYYRTRMKLAAEFNLPFSATVKGAKIIQEKTLLERRIAAWQAVHDMFHYWHVIHKPFAIIMYLIMIIHILVAVYVGYVWIF